MQWGQASGLTTPVTIAFPISYNRSHSRPIPIPSTTESDSNSVFAASIQWHSKTNTFFTFTAGYNGIMTSWLSVNF